MEVHAHTHTSDPDSHRGRKKWTHYLWEFFMLFLAVTLGFFVENQREHYVEHHREKQFIESLINDIEADTTRLISIIRSRSLRDTSLGTMLHLINSDSASYYTKNIYFIASGISKYVPIQYTPNDGTMQQLKNAGGLRLIRKPWVTDSIVRYDVTARSLQRLGEQEADIVNSYREISVEIFNGLIMDKLSDEDNNAIPIDFNPPLEANYKKYLNVFNYRLVYVRNVNKGYKREARKLLKQAAGLLITLKKEYHLK
jgi:hypothetical protein